MHYGKHSVDLRFDHEQVLLKCCIQLMNCLQNLVETNANVISGIYNFGRCLIITEAR